MNQRRALITCADRYMGPAIAARFAELGYELICDTGPLHQQSAVEALLERARSATTWLAS